MIKKLLIAGAVLFNCGWISAIDLPMVINITPDFGFVQSSGTYQILDISHTGTNCKYALNFKVFSNLDAKWGIQISAPSMVSTDGKDKLDVFLVNYKIYGGTMTAIPPQSSNVWLPVPLLPTTIYQSTEKEATFNFFVFVTPRTAQMQKIYTTKIKISLIQL